MPSFQAEPENFLELLQIVRDGAEISLKSGEYKGPFTIEKSLTLCGTGAETVIFAVDEPALVVKVPGVRLENLAIARTVGGDKGEIALSATKETAPICQSVILTGIAPNVTWENANWDIPDVLDFGEVESDRQIERSWIVQVGTPCKISSDVSWLRVQDTHLSPGVQDLYLILDSQDIPTGTMLSGYMSIEAADGNRVVQISAFIRANQPTNVQPIYTRSNNSEDAVRERVIPTKKQLQVWHTFLEIEERIAQSRQFCVPFQNHNYGGDTRRVTFEIDAVAATLDGSSANKLDENDFWQRAKKARNEDVMLFDSSPQYSNKRDGEKLGTIADVDFEESKIRIRLDSDFIERLNRGRYKLSHKGFLYFEAAGDIHQINQKKKALDNLRQGRSQNSLLGQFLFNADKAKRPSKIIKLQPQDLLKRDANPDQIAAVEAVLSAPDMVLIQGPPGTGKTTVIAEICYQVALRGGKTLITSQANLAVDNALSRLVHSPVIRALRKGKAEKVQEEGQPFLEDNVIGTWLQNTADDCENNLSKRQENVQIFQKLLKSASRFATYLKVEEEFQETQKQFQAEKTALEGNYQKSETIYKQSSDTITEVQSFKTKLDNLLQTAPNVDWDSPEVVNFLPLLKPYTNGNQAVENFVANVRTALTKVTELGFTRPTRGAFGLAVWLQETVATAISEFEEVSSDARNAAQCMLAVSESVQVFKKNSEDFQQLQRDYQQSLTKQQNIETKIKTLESRKSELEFVVNAVKEWKSTANTRLYRLLKNCRQTGSLLTDELIELPAGLWMIARTLNLPLVTPNYKVNKIDYLPNWVQLKNALSYEVEGGFVDRRGKQHRFSEFFYQTLSQIPMVLSASYYQEWQELAKKYKNYGYIASKWRPPLIENTRHFLNEMQQMYGASWESKNIDATLNYLVKEILENILVNARQCVLSIKIETEKQFQYWQQQLKEIQKSTAAQKQQISAAQYQLEIAQQEGDLKLNQVTNLLQKLTHHQNLPENLRILAEHYLVNQSSIWENPKQFLTQVESWEPSTKELKPLIAALDPFAVLQIIKTCLDEHQAKSETEYETARLQIEELQRQLNELEQKAQSQIPEDVIRDRQWWEKAWQSLPQQYKPALTSTSLFSLEFLHQVKAQFDSWQRELDKEENYLKRYQNFVQDWIGKLRHPSPQDRNELKQIYINNANVIGITCVQAARGDFSKEFPSFDVVIVDEVSKCTPPELLIPALKGEKIVLVGDHRQLPPLLHEETIEDIAEELKMTKDELSFVKESLFKMQFEAAHSSIKQMLTVQYRMHPQIMGAINQFYQHRLTCGIPEPETKRAHYLGSPIIQENHHILWVKTPVEQGFAEQREGTSRFNAREVDIIEKLCEQMEKAWFSKIADGQPQKEVGIITFYSAQLRAIKDRIETDKFPSLNIRTGTVDIFQGMERPVIIVSTVCNNSRKDIGFAKEPERVNVAFSRAQELLVIVGCHDLFTQKVGQVGNMYQEVSKVVRRYGGFVDVSDILSLKE
ncbi:DNA helicase [Scytonema hofmannii PCC 7110]|uniref:DNA helicase n=1 Tax=Scytonema hofmannii PCC 7110 TaxID=128403 RepID=A0A139XB44_9CYAN|nr:AAA domain-containing protein [Scytonema hofmannii]KYC41927.1 DNA helicase [Scytonema hofmannii PCC 7110]